MFLTLATGEKAQQVWQFQVWPVALSLVLLGTVPCSAQLPETRLVDVAGHPVRVRLGGWTRSDGAPTVVLESAFRESLESWDSIFEQVVSLAPVFAYDRARNGGSPDDGRAPTPRHVAERLHTLLAALGAKPPYVLVGHSWGGPLVRMFTGLYPNEVAGIVYIDPTDLRPLHEEVAYYREQGYVGEAMVQRKASLLRFRDPEQPETKVLLDTVQGDFKDFRALPPLPDVPMAVLMSASFGPASWQEAPCEPKVCEGALVRWRIHWLRQMMEGTSNGTLTVATSVGHFMQRDDPDLVVSAIQRVLTLARRAK
jgi:pimeloyl-ACP methyl ester carboxylesterase